MFRIFDTEEAALEYRALLDTEAGLPRCDCEEQRSQGIFAECTCDHEQAIFDPSCAFVTLHVAVPMKLLDGYAVRVPDGQEQEGDVPFDALEWPPFEF